MRQLLPWAKLHFWPEKQVPLWAEKGVLLGLDLVSESCVGEKHSPSQRTGDSSWLPKRGSSSLVWEGQPALGAG